MHCAAYRWCICILTLIVAEQYYFINPDKARPNLMEHAWYSQIDVWLCDAMYISRACCIMLASVD